jgi:3-oxoacyl-[acyl-carrier-protein] synthase-3
MALDAAGLPRDQVALLLLATSTPDHLLPPSAPLLAYRLGLTEAGGIDLAGACSGFLYALALADAFVRTHRAPVVVVAANILSRRINSADLGSAVLFADAAGAVVLAPTSRPNAGVQGVKLAASGADYALIQIPAGGSRRPFAADVPIMDTRMVLADGKAVYAKAIAMMTECSRMALHKAGQATTDVAHFVPHQANARMIETLRAGLGIAPERLLTTVADYANSSAATIPFTLSMHAAGRDYSQGDLVLMTAAGAGLVGGAIAWGW